MGNVVSASGMSSRMSRGGCDARHGSRKDAVWRGCLAPLADTGAAPGRTGRERCAVLGVRNLSARFCNWLCFYGGAVMEEDKFIVRRGYKYDRLIAVGNVAFHSKDLRGAIDIEMIDAGFGSGNHAHPYHCPPFFRTGSPYGQQILALARRHGLHERAVPDDMDCAFVPHYPRETPGPKRAWPLVFGCDASLEWPMGTINKYP